MNESIKEYVQSERYAKNTSKMIADVNAAMDNIKTTDAATRLKGAKRLSYHSRRELGYECLAIREWFCDDNTRIELSEICCGESDCKVLRDLLSTVKFIYSRYMIHFMWRDFFTLERIKEDESKYMKWVFPIAENCLRLSADVEVEIAGIFAICRDSRAWDIYNEILPKKSALCSWARADIRDYAQYSITETQKNNLIQTLDKIRGKVKNPSTQREAEKIVKNLLEVPTTAV